jgi:hypothetical protein
MMAFKKFIFLQKMAKRTNETKRQSEKKVLKLQNERKSCSDLARFQIGQLGTKFEAQTCFLWIGQGKAQRFFFDDSFVFAAKRPTFMKLSIFLFDFSR